MTAKDDARGAALALNRIKIRLKEAGAPEFTDDQVTGCALRLLEHVTQEQALAAIAASQMVDAWWDEGSVQVERRPDPTILAVMAGAPVDATSSPVTAGPSVYPATEDGFLQALWDQPGEALKEAAERFADEDGNVPYRDEGYQKFVDGRSRLTKAQLMALTGATEWQARKLLASLKEAGAVEQVGEKRGASYRAAVVDENWYGFDHLEEEAYHERFLERRRDALSGDGNGDGDVPA